MTKISFLITHDLPLMHPMTYKNVKIGEVLSSVPEGDKWRITAEVDDLFAQNVIMKSQPDAIVGRYI